MILNQPKTDKCKMECGEAASLRDYGILFILILSLANFVATFTHDLLCTANNLETEYFLII
jgi:hypothetical protein